MSGGFTGGVWGFHLGPQLPIGSEVTVRVPGRSLGWILQDRVSTQKEKSPRGDSLEESEAATQHLLSLKQRSKYSSRFLGGGLGSSQRSELLA